MTAIVIWTGIVTCIQFIEIPGIVQTDEKDENQQGYNVEYFISLRGFHDVNELTQD
ncbi:MAG: hypothetical protein O9262_04045 [Cyclobacteriaceae bacterium]|nr:hypothetical protein [Cyclobacteriaceae bacterium]